MLAADESYSEYSSGSSSPPCDLSAIERLHRTHPVWFLPDIQRAGAVHLLQSKEEGVRYISLSQHLFFTHISPFKELRGPRLQSGEYDGEHNGRVSSIASRHWSVHRTLSHSVASGSTEFGELQVQVRLNTGVDRPLFTMLVCCH